MNEEVEIYGFGSFFRGSTESQDIDILIIHRSSAFESCRFSIWCKKTLLSKLTDADITILSKSEERQISFVTKSGARRLGKVCEVSAENDLHAILRKIVDGAGEKHNKKINLDANSADAPFAPVI